MEKILITGGSGLLGSNLAKIASSKYETHAVYRKNRVSIRGVNLLQADLTKKESVYDLKKLKPDHIINCAALVNIDYCEEHREEAYKENVILAHNIALAAKDIGATLLHISTDSVFDGAKGNYAEKDQTNPINVYGETKLEAEKKVFEAYPRACVIRTNIHGWNKLDKKSLSEWMVDRLSRGMELPGFSDAYFSPIFVNDLARILLELLEKDIRGVIHIAGRESCSKLSFAGKVADVFGYDASLIKSTRLEDAKLKAPRGRNMSLNVSAAEKILGRNLPDACEGLMHMRHALETGYVKELKDG
jgi:dTDP-4-dehydrorhamnose reductase